MSSGLFTLFAMLAFIGISVWVFLIKSKSDFDDQAHMPLDDEPASSTSSKQHKETSS